jgi:hypothetical protein
VCSSRCFVAVRAFAFACANLFACRVALSRCVRSRSRAGMWGGNQTENRPENRPKSDRKPTKIDPKSDLGAPWDASGPPSTVQERQRATQEAPREPPGAPRTPLGAPGGSPRAPWGVEKVAREAPEAPRSDQNRPKCPSRSENTDFRSRSTVEDLFGSIFVCFFDQKRCAISARVCGSADVKRGSDEHGRHAFRTVNTSVPAMFARKRLRTHRRKKRRNGHQNRRRNATRAELVDAAVSV